MIEYIFLILAIPLGILCAKTTLDEHPIYSKKRYFPTAVKILAIISAISVSQNQQLFLTTAFILITTHVWHKT
jgi:hypothetical protein